jgi:hypothetical protein
LTASAYVEFAKLCEEMEQPLRARPLHCFAIRIR